jgi:serine protease Do
VADLAVGDRVVIVGSPAGLDFSVQEGSISSLQRSSEGVAYLQLDSTVSPGNSGGPVVDAQGRVVGVVSMKVSGEGVEGIGIALPINYVYSPEIAFVGPPSAAAGASAAFRQMLARAESGSDVGAREAYAGPPSPGSAGGLDDRPLLLSGRADQYGRLVVGVLRATDFPPGFEEIEVTVWSGTESFCTLKGDIGEWKLVDASVGAGLDRRALAALRRMAPGQTLYLGESPLRWDLCDRSRMRRGIQIELAGANPVASRLEVR